MSILVLRAQGEEMDAWRRNLSGTPKVLSPDVHLPDRRAAYDVDGGEYTSGDSDIRSHVALLWMRVDGQHLRGRLPRILDVLCHRGTRRTRWRDPLCCDADLRQPRFPRLHLPSGTVVQHEERVFRGDDGIDIPVYTVCKSLCGRMPAFESPRQRTIQVMLDAM